MFCFMYIINMKAIAKKNAKQFNLDKFFKLLIIFLFYFNSSKNVPKTFICIACMDFINVLKYNWLK